MSEVNNIIQVNGNISQLLTLTGNITNSLQISGSLSKEQDLNVQVEILDKVIGNLSNMLSISGCLAKQNNITGSLSTNISYNIDQDYMGEYFVIPSASQQKILNTEFKKMYNNVTVDKIPYYETTNESNGYTVIIG